MVRIRTLVALAATAGALSAFTPSASAQTWCAPAQTSPVYRGCVYVSGTCVTSQGYILNKPYWLRCPH